MKITGISILIPSRNRPEELERLLLSLRQSLSKCPEVAHEIIVISDGVEKENRQKYEHLSCSHGFVLLENERAEGPSHARNRGAEQAEYDWLLFFDDDLVVDENYFCNLQVLELADDCVCIDGITEVEKPAENILRRNAALSDFIGGFGSGNIIYRKTDFLAVGGFDHNYFLRPVGIHFREDTDLGLRIMGRGSVIVAENLRTFHPSARQRDYFCLLRDAGKYYFEPYFRRNNPDWRDWVGGIWQKGRLGTRQTRGFVSDMLLLFCVLAVIFPMWPFWGFFGLFYIILAFLLFRRSGKTALQRPLILLLVLPYSLMHSLAFWAGFFRLRKKERCFYTFAASSE
jgi:glycosyltransferase involved in cell wall biosynthesis